MLNEFDKNQKEATMLLQKENIQNWEHEFLFRGFLGFLRLTVYALRLLIP
jgi:hypothetical protein